jgi:4-hydroxy-tetrahydrodipicolinate reductase
MESPLRILLVGANGRMGRAIIEAVKTQPNFSIASRCQRGDVFEEKMENVDVVIDVSHPDATEKLCAACTKSVVPLVIGTTGHSAGQRRTIEEAARALPIVSASNFSIGVNVLFALTDTAGRVLGSAFNPEIIESHHRLKKDAPSGTAKTIAQILRTARGTSEEIPIQSIREGDLVGEHTVIFKGEGERLELTHRAESREIFARGALRAARWVVDKPAGLHSMQDVLGLSL